MRTAADNNQCYILTLKTKLYEDTDATVCDYVDMLNAYTFYQ